MGMNNIILVIYAGSESDFNKNAEYHKKMGFEDRQIVFCDSRRMSRLKCLSLYPQRLCVFVDSDCHLKNLEFIGELQSRTQDFSICWTGLYQNPSDASLFQRLQNFIANTWLEQSYRSDKQSPMLLGGCFCVYLKEPIVVAEFEDKLFWGGEDKELANFLRSSGVVFKFSKEYQVEHRTQTGWKHFLKRALKHGYYEAGVSPKNRDMNFSYRFWIRKIGSEDWRLRPLILLHFCIQRLAKLFRIVLPQNKK